MATEAEGIQNIGKILEKKLSEICDIKTFKTILPPIETIQKHIFNQSRRF